MTLNIKISKLRNAAKLSQEEFAEVFGVSQQSVQKWESGTTVPDLDKLIKISKYFGLSLDSLVLDKTNREAEIEAEKSILPNVEIAGNWELYSESVMQEYYQCLQEGKDIKKYRNYISAVSELPHSNFKTRVSDAIFDLILNLPDRPDFKYIEPSDYEKIKVLRKPYALKNISFDKEKAYSRVYGAWLGRIIGCALGKTVECCSPEEIKSFLKKTGNYPMHRYIYYSDLEKINPDDYRFNFKQSYYVDQFGDFTFADDDTNYTVLSQIIVECHGREFTPYDVAGAWLSAQLRDAHCTAEKVAYINLINGYFPPDSAMYKNPYREWIGAQIRGDYFGYINPGNPEKAAEMAFKDACVSHTKNGIYGEMFVAAALAAAGVCENIEEIILCGLGQIPSTSRFYEDIIYVYECYKSGKSCKEVLRAIHEKYTNAENGGGVHTLPNAMIVAAALLYGEKDFGKSICTAVETGFDTDCNAATVGSILGMAIGVGKIPGYWKEPIKDKLETGIYRSETVEISKCAERTLKHMEYPII